MTIARNGKEKTILKQEINTLLKKRAIEVIPDSQAKFVSKLFLIQKKSGDYRPVVNLKPLNHFIKTEEFKMETITNLQTILKQGDWMITIDLSDAYMTIPVAESFKDYLAFKFRNVTYRFLVLPFGINDAPRAFTRTMKPPIANVRTLGFRVIVYLDDILLAAASKQLCSTQGRILIKLLQDLGFVINFRKSNLVPSQIIQFLGFIVDSRDMSFTLPPIKVRDLISKANYLKSQRNVTLREISQFLGMCISTKLAVKQAPLHIRYLQRLLIKHMKKFGNQFQVNYQKVVTLDSLSIQDLSWWITKLQDNCSSPICPPPPDIRIASDSSDFAWGAHLDAVKIQGLWKSHQLDWHINIKELMAAFLALQFLIPNHREIHVQISMDNTTAVSYVNRLGGTKSEHLTSIATEMWAWCLEKKIFLSAIYLPGQKMIIADPLSRLKNLSTEWMLNKLIFRRIVALFGRPDIDLFASSLNCQIKDYVAWAPDPNAQAVDAFTITWNHPLIYAFPPFSLIQKCLQKIIQDKARVILIAPVWRSRPWFPILLSLLKDRPCLLPQHPLLIHLPWEKLPHPFLKQHKFRLAAWPLSGDPSDSKKFLRGCPRFCSLPGEKVLKNSMSVSGGNSVAGVLKNHTIRFLAI